MIYINILKVYVQGHGHALEYSCMYQGIYSSDSYMIEETLSTGTPISLILYGSGIHKLF